MNNNKKIQITSLHIYNNVTKITVRVINDYSLQQQQHIKGGFTLTIILTTTVVPKMHAILKI